MVNCPANGTTVSSLHHRLPAVDRGQFVFSAQDYVLGANWNRTPHHRRRRSALKKKCSFVPFLHSRRLESSFEPVVQKRKRVLKEKNESWGRTP